MTEARLKSLFEKLPNELKALAEAPGKCTFTREPGGPWQPAGNTCRNANCTCPYPSPILFKKLREDVLLPGTGGLEVQVQGSFQGSVTLRVPGEVHTPRDRDNDDAHTAPLRGSFVVFVPEAETLITWTDCECPDVDD